MKDNPTATPEELEAGAKQVLAEIGGGGTPAPQQTNETFLDENYFRTNFNEAQLKELSDKAGTSKWYSTKGADINRFLKETMAKIEEARRQGYSDDEILKFLTE
jgi:hypothetical protein